MEELYKLLETIDKDDCRTIDQIIKFIKNITKKQEYSENEKIISKEDELSEDSSKSNVSFEQMVKNAQQYAKDTGKSAFTV